MGHSQLKLALDLVSAIAHRPEFGEYSGDEVKRAGRLFVIFGFRPIGEIRLSRQKNRDYFESDMRNCG